MSKTTKVNPDLAKLVERSSETLNATETVAKKVQGAAASIATWGNGSVGRDIKVMRVAENSRVFYRVAAMNFKSHWFEFGTRFMRARPFLSKGAERVGLKIEARRGGSK